MTELARLLDRDELDAAEGPRGTMTVELPREWLESGATVEVLVPTRLACGRCEGGGCDACDRSGAIRLAGEPAERTTRFVLPKTTNEHLVVRLVRPLGEGVALAQLRIEVRAASTLPTTGCERIEPAHAARPAPPLSTAHIAVIVAIAIAAAIAAGLR